MQICPEKRGKRTVDNYFGGKFQEAEIRGDISVVCRGFY